MELASKALWAMIIFDISCDRLTLDASSVPVWMVPRLPVPADWTVMVPELDGRRVEVAAVARQSAGVGEVGQGDLPQGLSNSVGE